MANVQNTNEFWLSNEKLSYLLSNNIKFTIIENGDERSKIQVEIVSGITLSSLIYAGVQCGIDETVRSYESKLQKHQDVNEEMDIVRDREMYSEPFSNEILQREEVI